MIRTEQSPRHAQSSRDPPPPPTIFQDVRANGLFSVARTDGESGECRYRPVRHLIADNDDASSARSVQRISRRSPTELCEIRLRSFSLFARFPHQEVDPVSSDSSSPKHDPCSSHGGEARLSQVRHVTRDDGTAETWYKYLVEPDTPSFTFEHDKQKRLFVLTWSDGRTETFRDNPARLLMVEPDPETGEMRPVIRRGRPTYIYLSREEREL